MNTTDTQTNTAELMLDIGKKAKAAARILRNATDKQKSAALRQMAELLLEKKDDLIAANQKDLEAAKEKNLAAALVDRLTISETTIQSMATGLRQIADMPDPVGKRSETIVRPNGMMVAQMRVPIGVIGIIYESRPNVTIDAAALCINSGNATILRGGSEAFHSNQALGEVILEGLRAAKLPDECVQVIPTTDRAAVGVLVTMTDYVDVIVPRGGKGDRKSVV